jgi:hypothetical protein
MSTKGTSIDINVMMEAQVGDVRNALTEIHGLFLRLIFIGFIQAVNILKET